VITSLPVNSPDDVLQKNDMVGGLVSDPVIVSAETAVSCIREMIKYDDHRQDCSQLARGILPVFNLLKGRFFVFVFSFCCSVPNFTLVGGGAGVWNPDTTLFRVLNIVDFAQQVQKSSLSVL